MTMTAGQCCACATSAQMPPPTMQPTPILTAEAMPCTCSRVVVNKMGRMEMCSSSAKGPTHSGMRS